MHVKNLHTEFSCMFEFFIFFCNLSLNIVIFLLSTSLGLEDEGFFFLNKLSSIKDINEVSYTVVFLNIEQLRMVFYQITFQFLGLHMYTHTHTHLCLS